ncbi:MAG: TIGR02996 domain-containing protein [Archangium sp.]|nr:TIGR02996 domain-containing protein [Archangium sp.]MDP3155138.1 TIGR02996 domain-containing protein [Archangium sp.]MDP3573351.1 TIGR02996 domain-containing protein [Archangium sp.]
MNREAALLEQLAERPDDRALRLVFSDWLQEQGDERGEVIALWARGNLSLTERRRVARLTTTHGGEWLGPLAALADLHRTRFVGGFVDELVCAPSRPSELFAALNGDVRLATVKSFVVPPTQAPARLGAFLSSPVLRHLQKLELGSSDWQDLFLTPPLATTLAPPRVVVGSWGVFHKELAPLSSVKLFQQASSLALSTTEFINPLVVAEIHESVLSQSNALQGFEELMLAARYVVFEGAADWLLACDLDRRATGTVFPRLLRWGVESGEVAFVRTREPGGAFDHLTIDLSAPESGEKRAVSTTPAAEVRIANAAAVLVQLREAKLTSVTVKLPEGGRLRTHERGTLMAAARRSGSLEHFSIIGESAVLP